MKLTVSTPEECPFRETHYESQLYWYEKCLLLKKPQACEKVCSENRCPLKQHRQIKVVYQK